jgi:hypothetical protein
LKHQHLALFLVATGVWAALLQCSPVPLSLKATGTAPPDSHSGLDPSRHYAGEVLSHMMRVVLGDAGAPEMRETWKNRGLNVRLDLDHIGSLLNSGGKGKFDLMVFDPNILGLSEVLYHYDKMLNQFRGKHLFNSIYPSPELIALRLLLVQKRHRGEKIRIKPLVERASMLLKPSIEATEADLLATNLNAQEMRLLEAVLEEDPSFFLYLRHPFLLSALYEADLIENDEVVKEARESAGYKEYRCCAVDEPASPPVVKIVLLPSLIDEFEFDPDDAGLNHYGFLPTASYQKAMRQLEKDILSVTERLVKEAVTRKAGQSLPDVSRRWNAWWQHLVRKNIVFVHQDQRPFVILPGNAQGMVNDICPGVDFSVIILGKNVYRSILFDKKSDTYPAVNRLYLDFLDVKFAQVADEIDQISRFILLKLNESDILTMSQTDRPEKRPIHLRWQGEARCCLNSMKKDA